MTSPVMEIPREFKPLFEDWWREAAIYGGRYSLKSHSVARYLLIRARQEKTRVGCFREFQNSIQESSKQLLTDLIQQYELSDFKVTDNAIVNAHTGSDFLFKGLHRNEQNIKSTEGLDIAWIEEAQTVSQKSIDILTPTVRKPGSKIIYTYNREEEADPVHQRLVIEGRPDALVINVNYEIALRKGLIPDVILKEIEDDKAKRPNLYKYKWLGEPNTNLEGRIYTGWQEIDDIPHEARLERYGLDFGYNPDPCAVVAVYYYNGGYILDEQVYQLGMSNREIANTLKNLPKALIVADSAEPKSIDELKMYGLNVVPAVKGPDSVRSGIKTVQDQQISVTRRSSNLLKEYRNYLWDVDRDGKIIPGVPEDANNHALDAARYAINSLAPVLRRKELLVKLRPVRTQRVNNAV